MLAALFSVSTVLCILHATYLLTGMHSLRYGTTTFD
jgi:hypothetical protein